MPARSLRLFLLVVLNLALLPLYGAVFALLLVIVWLPLFPCRTGARNLRERMGAGFFGARMRMACIFFHYFEYVIEAIVVWPLGLTTLTNADELDAFFRNFHAKYEGRGPLLLSAHFGNIEVLGESVTRSMKSVYGRGFHTLAQPSRFALFTTLMEWYRSRRGLDILLTNRKDLVRRLLALSKEGQSLALLVDQKPQTGGIFLSFLSAPAAFPFRGMDIAVRAGLPAVYLAVRRRFPGCFEIFFSEGMNTHCEAFRARPERSGNLVAGLSTVVAFPEGDPASALATVMAGYTAWLEALIRRHPLQWFWDYRKWSRAVPTPPSAP